MTKSRSKLVICFLPTHNFYWNSKNHYNGILYTRCANYEWDHIFPIKVSSNNEYKIRTFFIIIILRSIYQGNHASRLILHKTDPRMFIGLHCPMDIRWLVNLGLDNVKESARGASKCARGANCLSPKNNFKSEQLITCFLAADGVGS